jgi:gamma-glutamyltranspeptidase
VVLVDNSTVGGMAVAVPGELAGLEYAWLNYGSGNVRA